MIIAFGAILGAFTGAFLAYRRKGKPADIAQYALVYAIMFALAGLFIVLMIYRA